MSWSEKERCPTCGSESCITTTFGTTNSAPDIGNKRTCTKCGQRWRRTIDGGYAKVVK